MLPKKTSQSIALCLLFAVSLSAQVSAEKQVRLVVQGSSPKIPKGSFAEKPKVIHRLGDKFARIEEEHNPETNLKLLIVTKAPDTWMVNLADGTGNHMVDPDPKGKVKFPIFPKEGMPAGYPPPMEDLEFGREALYFDSFKAPYTPMKTPKGEMVKQVLGTDDWTLILVRKEEKGVPVFLFLTNKEGIVTVFEYLEYKILSEPNLKVFDAPKNVQFREQPAS
jgi:hypothetical protein